MTTETEINDQTETLTPAELTQIAAALVDQMENLNRVLARLIAIVNLSEVRKELLAQQEQDGDSIELTGDWRIDHSRLVERFGDDYFE